MPPWGAARRVLDAVEEVTVVVIVTAAWVTVVAAIVIDMMA